MFNSKESRDTAIKEYFRIEDELRSINNGDHATQNLLKQDRRECARYYFDNLPQVPLSRCPLCNALHTRAFDPWGVDGLWWQYEECIVPIREPSGCAHFRFLQGSVDFGTRDPKGGRSKAIVGPTAPFVIPRILSLAGVVAVVAQISFGDDFTAWPVGYFSDQAINAWDLHQEWTKPSLPCRLPNSKRVFWKIADEMTVLVIRGVNVWINGMLMMTTMLGMLLLGIGHITKVVW